MTAFVATQDSSRVGIRIIAESNAGVTPTLPTGKELEITGESLNNAKQHTTSVSFRTDRQVPGLVKTGETSTGDLMTELKFSPLIDDLFAATLQGTWVANSVSNGVNRKSYTVEKLFPDAVGDAVQLYRGSEFTQLQVSIATGQLITAHFTLIARDFAVANTTVCNAVVPAATTDFMSATVDGVGLKVGGVDYTGGLTKFDFTLNNNGREQRQIATTALAGIGMGRSSVTGTLSGYFNGSNALYAAYKADTPTSIEIDVPDIVGNTYGFIFHKVKITDVKLNAGALDQDVMMDATFTAYLDDSSGKTLTITRQAA